MLEGIKSRLDVTKEYISNMEDRLMEITQSLQHKEKKKEFLKMRIVGLPWWRSGCESACRCRGHRFGPWSGKIPHAAERLGP